MLKLKEITTEYQRILIRQIIQEELLKRGFTPKIIKFQEKVTGGNYNRIEFETETLQTTPVLFKEIKIRDSRSYIELVTGADAHSNFFRFSLHIRADLYLFDGGFHACDIFNLKGTFYKGDIHLNNYTIS